MDKMKKLRLLHTLGYACVILSLSAASGAAYAGGGGIIMPPPTSLGGPGTLFLLGVGAAIGVVTAIRNKWKK